jgi:hypothetical protein
MLEKIKRNKNKLITVIVIAIVLVAAYWYGGNSDELHGWSVSDTKNNVADTTPMTDIVSNNLQENCASMAVSVSDNDTSDAAADNNLTCITPSTTEPDDIIFDGEVTPTEIIENSALTATPALKAENSALTVTPASKVENSALTVTPASKVENSALTVTPASKAEKLALTVTPVKKADITSSTITPADKAEIKALTVTPVDKAEIKALTVTPTDKAKIRVLTITPVKKDDANVLTVTPVKESNSTVLTVAPTNNSDLKELTVTPNKKNDKAVLTVTPSITSEISTVTPVSSDAGTLKCYFLIECKTVFNHTDWLNPALLNSLPSDGCILKKTEVKLKKGETVFDVLKSICKSNEINLEYSYTPAYHSTYIEGIADLYEFDCGELSGWMYSVNGVFPSYASSEYVLENGDIVEWRYTCDLGGDL